MNLRDSLRQHWTARFSGGWREDVRGARDEIFDDALGWLVEHTDDLLGLAKRFPRFEDKDLLLAVWAVLRNGQDTDNVRLFNDPVVHDDDYVPVQAEWFAGGGQNTNDE